MKYARVVAEFYSRYWALPEEMLLAMQELLRVQSLDGLKWTGEEIQQRIDAANIKHGYVSQTREGPHFLAFDDEPMPMMGAGGKRNSAAAGSVAVIPIIGTISHRMSLMSQVSGGGGASTQALSAQLRQCMDDGNVKAIVLDVDSLGGAVDGVTELAAEIFAARKSKKILAVCNSIMASAAYWLGSAANEVICTPSGQAGSIGVFTLLQDESKALEKEGVKVHLVKAGKFKAEANSTQPITSEMLQAVQDRVDQVYTMFVKDIARNRGVAQAAVREGYGQGRMEFAAAAVKAGLVDRVATFDDVLAELGVKPASSASASATAESCTCGAQETYYSKGLEPPKTWAKCGFKHVMAADPKAKTEPDEEDDENGGMCGCNGGGSARCSACQGCTGDPSAKAGSSACLCSCAACQACGFKSSSEERLKIAARRLELMKM